MKKPRGYSAAQTQDPWITSQTPYHWATWDPKKVVGKVENAGYNDVLGNGLRLKKMYLVEPYPKQAQVFTCLLYKCFENTVEKGEIARNEQFLLFPQCFLSV